MISLSCRSEPTTTPINFTETPVDISTHKLEAFSVLKKSKSLVVFESGRGDIILGLPKNEQLKARISQHFAKKRKLNFKTNIKYNVRKTI